MTIVANTFEGVTLPLISNQQKDYLAVLLDILSKHLDSNSKNSARCLFVDFTCALNIISPTTLVNQLGASSIVAAVDYPKIKNADWSIQIFF